MKFKYILILACLTGAAIAYTQSDLLAAQYTYQTTNDKLTQAKDEKKSASDALAKAKSKVEDAQKKLKEAQQEYQTAQTRSKNAESSLLQATKDFSSANQKVNQIWNSLNPK